MKPTFHHRLINGPFDDPALYVRLFWQKRALLFDAGDISALDHAELLKVSDVFVTHTHIDHFIGFDLLVRAHLRNERPLRIYGPADIIDNIEGKLRGYTWNLIEQYPLRLEAFGIGADTIKQASFHASNSFGRMDREERPYNGIVLDDELFKVCATVLKHDVQCLGYALQEDYHINIDKAALTSRGLPVGPWLAELKSMIRNCASDDAELDIGGNSFMLKDLRDLAMVTKGQKIAYVMDAEPTDANSKSIRELVEGADTLYMEAYFMEEDRDRAQERHHLTAKLAARIAREAGVKELVVTHFSPKYKGAERTPEQEALEEFDRPS